MVLQAFKVITENTETINVNRIFFIFLPLNNYIRQKLIQIVLTYQNHCAYCHTFKHDTSDIKIMKLSYFDSVNIDTKNSKKHIKLLKINSLMYFKESWHRHCIILGIATLD